MNKNKKGKIALVLFLVVPVILFLVWQQAEERYNALPYMGTYVGDTSILANKTYVDSILKDNYFVQGDSVFEMWTLRDFDLIDQTGKRVNLSTFDDKIIIANFFYATCPEICPRMNNNLRLAVEKYKDNPNVVFLSHTVHPEHDSLPVLADYAKKYGYANDKWYFVTGFKHEIYDLAVNHYHAAAPMPDGQYDFIHSTLVFPVDKEGRVRGYYESQDNPRFATQVKDAIKVLLAEYNQPEKFNDKER